MAVISNDKIVASTDNGDVSIVRHHMDTMDQIQRWSSLHYYETTKETASCSCIATNENEIITGMSIYSTNKIYIPNINLTKFEPLKFFRS